ncbi:hypothetical protein HOY82DRAFT_537460 [Tuber indicum]|nr:hypothetical protein HOY82DRAFT_537460 [Tuber indicum]
MYCTSYGKVDQFHPQRDCIEGDIPYRQTDNQAVSSGGQVKIVVLTSLSEPAERIHIEKWETVNPQVAPQPYTLTVAPTKTYELDIVGDMFNGASRNSKLRKSCSINRINITDDIRLGHKNEYKDLLHSS